MAVTLAACARCEEIEVGRLVGSRRGQRGTKRPLKRPYYTPSATETQTRPIPGPTIGEKNFFGDITFAGPDNGDGGFLLLPPNYKGDVPEGYFVFRSATNNVFISLRAFYEDPNDLRPPVSRIEQAKVHPLDGKTNVKPMQCPDVSGVPANMLPRGDASAFEQLKMLIDSEPDSIADPDWLGMLATLGLIKGKPFNPDSNTKAILQRAANTAYKMSRMIDFEESVDGVSCLVYPDRHWTNPWASGAPFDFVWTRPEAGYQCPELEDQFLHKLLFDQPWHVVADAGQGCKLHDRLQRQRRLTFVR